MKANRFLIGGLLLAAAALVAFLVLAPRFEPVQTLSGYVEGEPLYPASPLSGRLVRIDVKRGDTVAAGAPLFAVDPSQGEAAQGQARADVAAAQALAVDARRGQRPAELGVIEANLRAAQATLNDAKKNLARVTPLAAAGAASHADLDAATAAEQTAQAQVAAIGKQLQVAKLGQRTDQIAAADSRVREAQAALAGADSRLADLAPVAPAAGRIEGTFFQPGEWVPANQPVLSLLPADRVRLRFFVPQDRVADYTIGRDVAFACDGCAAGLSAKISYVSPRPEFTPPVIYSREARDRLVFLVEATPAKPDGLVPGLPIDVQPLAANSSTAKR
jgi:HlyD family secretion protein